MSLYARCVACDRFVSLAYRFLHLLSAHPPLALCFKDADYTILFETAQFKG